MHSPEPASAYVRQLIQETERAALQPGISGLRRKRDALAARIDRWWSELPPEQRQTVYHMEDLHALFRAAPGRIGLALHQLGWVRVRSWSGQSAHRRVWHPPG
jgi:hypothetical protein